MKVVISVALMCLVVFAMYMILSFVYQNISLPMMRMGGEMSKMSAARKKVAMERGAYEADIGINPWGRQERSRLAVWFAFSESDKTGWYNRKTRKQMEMVR